MYFDEELLGDVLVPQTNICIAFAPALQHTIGDAINGGKYLQDGVVDIEAWAAYAEAAFQFTDQLTMADSYNYEERAGQNLST